jgi:hypothetical protein
LDVSLVEEGYFMENASALCAGSATLYRFFWSVEI